MAVEQSPLAIAPKASELSPFAEEPRPNAVELPPTAEAKAPMAVALEL